MKWKICILFKINYSTSPGIMESLKQFQNEAPEYCPSSVLPFFDKHFSKLLPPTVPGSLSIPMSRDGMNPNPRRLINRLKANKTEAKVPYLTIYTQNIWFSQSDQAERFEEIVRFIEEFQPDFVCLQEFILTFSERLRKSDIIVQNYFLSENSGNWYTVQILSKWPCRVTKIPYKEHTVMARSLLLASTVINGVPITISTSHLESSDGQQGYDLRCKQMEIAFSALKHHTNVMIMGDFNYDAVKGKEEETRDKSFVDLFDSGPESTLKFTYIPREERLDRMLLRGTDWEPTGGYYLVGTEPIPKYQGMSIFQGVKVRTLSDHLGIISTIRFKEGRDFNQD